MTADDTARTASESSGSASLSSAAPTGQPARHTAAFRPPVALTIAGTDPSGGAGIHADLKTFTARGVYGTSVITALLAQNTHGVSRIYDIDHDFIVDQMISVVDDVYVDASKSGMLSSPQLVEMTADCARRGKLGFLVADPVMVATSGHRLVQEDAIAAIRSSLLPAAGLITPNLPEAALLLGDDESPAQSPEQMRDQAMRLLRMGPTAVLLKGGHGSESTVTDVLAVAAPGRATGAHGFAAGHGSAAGARRAAELTAEDVQWREFTHPRIHSANTHGTGCTLSAAIAAEIAHRRRALTAAGADPAGASSFDSLAQAVETALDYLARAIASSADWQLSLDLNGAHGPVDHTVDITR